MAATDEALAQLLLGVLALQKQVGTLATAIAKDRLGDSAGAKSALHQAMVELNDETSSQLDDAMASIQRLLGSQGEDG